MSKNSNCTPHGHENLIIMTTQAAHLCNDLVEAFKKGLDADEIIGILEFNFLPRAKKFLEALEEASAE